MIYVATVHWRFPKWIAPQRRALYSQLREPFRVFANLQGIEPAYDDNFDYVTRSEGSHPKKLNDLAEAISKEAQPDDLIVFLDGDAFPVRELDSWLGDLLGGHPLAAVRRDENAGDIQPHPCFCVTSVGFWNEIGGDWRPGSWTTSEGQTASDVGGTLLTALTARSIPWRPILRSNAVNLHPVFYGLYEGHIYHHGSGFRPAISRADEGNVPVAENADYLFWRTRADTKSWRELRPRHLRLLVRMSRSSVQARKLNAFMRKEGKRSNEIYDELCSDPNFFRQFEQADSGSMAAS